MAGLIIGIAGGSGSGKTTVAGQIADGVRGVTIIEHDAYYRDLSNLTVEERAEVNFDHPDSLETSLLIQHLQELRQGRAIDVPLYDFTKHTRREETKRIEPTPVIVVEGILTFVEAELRDQFDICVFVDTDADIRVLRRIRRDLESRGRSFSEVREQYYKTVRPMHLQFVEPSKRWADIIIPEGGDRSVAVDLLTEKIRSVTTQSGFPGPMEHS